MVVLIGGPPRLMEQSSRPERRCFFGLLPTPTRCSCLAQWARQILLLSGTNDTTMTVASAVLRYFAGGPGPLNCTTMAAGPWPCAGRVHRFLRNCPPRPGRPGAAASTHPRALALPPPDVIIVTSGPPRSPCTAVDDQSLVTTMYFAIARGSEGGATLFTTTTSTQHHRSPVIEVVMLPPDHPTAPAHRWATAYLAQEWPKLLGALVSLGTHVVDVPDSSVSVWCCRCGSQKRS